MILPIGDEPNPRGIAVVNTLLIAANVAVFVFISLPLMGRPPDPNDPAAMQYLRFLMERAPGVDPRVLWSQVSAYDIFLLHWGYRPGSPSVVTLFTSMFLHGSVLHVAGNMLFLWIFGDNVEYRLGRIAYLVVYLATGAIAALAFGAVVTGASRAVPMVGASGAISGVLGLYFIWFPHNRVRLFIFLFPFLVDVWKVGARIVIGIFVVLDNLLPFLLERGQATGVAHGAHLGGVIAGAGIALAIEGASRARHTRRARRIGEATEAPGASAAATVAELAAAGETARAVRAFLALPPPERRGVPFEVVVDLGERVAAAGDAEAALALYRLALTDRPLDPARSRAFLGIGRTLLSRGRPTAAYQFLLDALDADPPADVEAATRSELAHIAAMQKFGRLG